MSKFLVAAAAALALCAPLAAQAQDAPSYAQRPVPSYASRDQAIHGRVVSFDGGYKLLVRDDRGFVDHVRLHQGTVINPTGLTLAAGMVVSIDGDNSGSYFSANEVDTPYVFYGGVPYYGGYPYWHYGPSVSLGFFFGDGGWGHGGWGRR
jgi:hypothetical protein